MSLDGVLQGCRAGIPKELRREVGSFCRGSCRLRFICLGVFDKAILL